MHDSKNVNRTTIANTADYRSGESQEFNERKNTIRYWLINHKFDVFLYYKSTWMQGIQWWDIACPSNVNTLSNSEKTISEGFYTGCYYIRNYHFHSSEKSSC